MKTVTGLIGPAARVRVIAGATALFCCFASSPASFAAEPLRALLVTGGCCHDYEAQKKILSEGISARANVTWTMVHEGTDRTHYVSIYPELRSRAIIFKGSRP